MHYLNILLISITPALASSIVQRNAQQALADLKQANSDLIQATNNFNGVSFENIVDIARIESDFNKSATDAATIPTGSCQDVTNLFNYLQSTIAGSSQKYVTTAVAHKDELAGINGKNTVFQNAKYLRESVARVFDVIIPKACTSGQGRALKDQIESYYTYLIYWFGPTTDGQGTFLEDLNFASTDCAALAAKVNNFDGSANTAYHLFSSFIHYRNDLTQLNNDATLLYAYGCSDSVNVSNATTKNLVPCTHSIATGLNAKKASFVKIGSFYTGRIHGYLQDLKNASDFVANTFQARVCTSYRAAITNAKNSFDADYNSAINNFA